MSVYQCSNTWSACYREGDGDVGTGGLIPISALHGTGLDELLVRLESALITRTRRKMWKIILPTNGPELRSDIFSTSVMTSSHTHTHTHTHTTHRTHTHILTHHTHTHTHTHTHSWLHGEQEATVCEVSPIATEEPHPQESVTPPTTDMTEYLSVRVVLTEAASSKFQARFSRSVRMIETFF